MSQNIETKNVKNNEVYEKKVLFEKIAGLNALACNNIKQEGFSLNRAISESQCHLKALSAVDGLQEMLAAQMLSIHNLQQTASAMANTLRHEDKDQYFTNAAIKLANCFTQQAALLARLQGAGGQKIIVERVEVHNGGQAIVGSSIRGGAPTSEVQK